MKNKRLLAALAILCVLAAVMAAVWQFSKPAGKDGNKAFTVEVIHGDGTTATFECQSDLEFLGEYLLEADLIEGTEGAYGLFVDTVNGETAVYADNAAWWQLSCNGEASQVGVDSVPIQHGFTYTWTYTIG